MPIDKMRFVVLFVIFLPRSVQKRLQEVFTVLCRKRSDLEKRKRKEMSLMVWSVRLHVCILYCTCVQVSFTFILKRLRFNCVALGRHCEHYFHAFELFLLTGAHGKNVLTHKGQRISITAHYQSQIVTMRRTNRETFFIHLSMHKWVVLIQ